MIVLTEEQQKILDGAQGETMAKVMETLVKYGELFGATRMVPVTGKHNHLVTSFGLKALGPVYELMDKLIESGAISQQTFSADPRPQDKNVPSNLIMNLIFNKFLCNHPIIVINYIRNLFPATRVNRKFRRLFTVIR